MSSVFAGCDIAACADRRAASTNTVRIIEASQLGGGAQIIHPCILSVIVPFTRRIVRVGLAIAALVGLIGYGVEYARFGASDQSALARVEAELRQHFDASAATLQGIAARIAAAPDTARAAPRDPASLKRLFDLAAAAVPED